jgi:RNA polymerase sigma-70 factor (ECF subfamily)
VPTEKSPRAPGSKLDLLQKAVNDYSRPLHRYLVRLLRSRDAANDVFQEVFMELCQAKRLEPIRNFRAYLFRIAWRVFSRRKKQGQDDTVCFDSEEADQRLDSPERALNDDVMAEVALESALEAAAGRLSQTQQSVLLLALYRNMNEQQIAASLGLSRHTVRKNLIIAKAKLRDSICKDPGRGS